MKGPDQTRLETVTPVEPLSFNKKELNDLVAFTAETLKVPIVILSLNGYEKQFTRGKIEAGIAPGSREISFCRHVADQNDQVFISDARFDEYLESNFMASGTHDFNFYAGEPLITSKGVHLGSVCVFDQKPRFFPGRLQKTLTTLSRQIAHLIELDMSLRLIHQQEAELNKQKEKISMSERKLRAFFKSSAFCHMLIGKDLDVLDFNKAMALFIKETHGKNVQIGNSVLEYTSPLYKNEFMICLTRAFAGKRINKEVLIKFEDKEPAWWNVFLEPVKDDYGRVISVVYNATNINEQKQRIAEITAQNKLLMDIAHVQSHEYRRPVASILGLMEVIRIQNLPLTEELQMMDEAVRELDQKIRSVISFTQILSRPDDLK